MLSAFMQKKRPDTKKAPHEGRSFIATAAPWLRRSRLLQLRCLLRPPVAFIINQSRSARSNRRRRSNRPLVEAIELRSLPSLQLRCSRDTVASIAEGEAIAQQGLSLGVADHIQHHRLTISMPAWSSCRRQGLSAPRMHLGR